MSVSCINYNGICTSVHQSFHTVECISSYSHTGSYTQTTFRIFASHWFIFCFCDIFISNQTYQLSILIYNRKFFNFIFLQNLGSSFHVCTRLCCYNVFLCHHLINTLIQILFKAQVTVCNNTDQIILIIYYRNTSDFVFSHQIECIFHYRTPLNGHRIINHSVFCTLHNCYLTSLLLDRHVLVNYSDTSFTSNGNGHLCFGNCIHRCSYKRNFQLNVT